ncbi:hypothetical protein WSM22_38290 [Cytophagales bacterium WSM2-2]|nr:hypothetical protein WSM22_38290 [Cytophagales bacterium WSM2-2]
MNAKECNDSAQYYYDHSQFDKAWKMAVQAKSIGERLELQEELFRSYSLMGSIEFRRGWLRKAQQLHKKGLAIADDLDNANLQAKALSNIASDLSKLGEYDSAEQILMQIVNIPELEDDMLLIAYGRLGVNFKRRQLNGQAIEYYIRSLTISEKRHDSLSSARTLANIGNIYIEQKEPARALEYYQKALLLLDSSKHAMTISGISVFAGDAYLAMRNYDQAEKILKRSLAIIKRLNLPDSESYACESLGILYLEQGKVHEAMKIFNEALLIQRKLNMWDQLESILMQLADCNVRLKNFRLAEVFLNESQQIAESHHHIIGLQSIYRLRTALDSTRGDFRSALNYFQKFVQSKDSLFTLEKAKMTEEVNKKFEADKKAKIIDEQKHIIDQQRSKEQLFIIVLILVTISGCIIYLVARRRTRLKETIVQEQQQKQKLVAIVIAQERIQQKIARDLHDSFVQVLGAAKINLESVKMLSTSPEFVTKIAETTTIIDRACQDARTIAHQLLPYSLEKHGLAMALQELLEKHPRKNGEQFIFKQETTSLRFQSDIEVNLYRIAQELINNIFKHAHANQVHVYLAQQSNHLLMSVNDDGAGFDPKTAEPGAGLLNIRSRLQSIRGTMRIESKPGEGTTTIIQIPLT